MEPFFLELSFGFINVHDITSVTYEHTIPKITMDDGTEYLCYDDDGDIRKLEDVVELLTIKPEDLKKVSQCKGEDDDEE